MTSSERPPPPGSTRYAAPGVRATGVPDPTALGDITVVLRRGQPLPALGADPADVAAAQQWLEAEGLEVLSVDLPSRRIQARGDVATLERVFGTSLSEVESPDPVTGRPVPHRQRTGELVLPSSLAGVVIAVLGLDDRPQARVRFRPAAGPTTSFTPLDLGRVYRFPAGTDGSGQTLAILELGGGYRQPDLDAYWAQIGLVDPPAITAVGIDGGANTPEGDPNGADGEVLLDIEVAGALAPGADLVVYFAPNTDRGFLDALSTAVHADPTPAAVSISWGQNEDEWTAQARTAMGEARTDAAVLGVTVCAASGDDGSTDNATDGQAHVDFPASSPHALACGGTTLRVDGRSGAVSSEVVWFHGPGLGGTGGGVSAVFPVPEYQVAAGLPVDADTGVPRLAPPDAASDADPATGYRVRVDGTDAVIGGTSAVSPLWSALTCRLAEALGRRPGMLHPLLYAEASEGQVPAGFRDVTSGSNGAYGAGA